MRVTTNVVWLVAAAVVPLLAGLLLALPFWIKRVKDEIGSVVGALVVFACVVGFIGREYVEIERVSANCVAKQIGCRFFPAHFTRYAIYGGIGMAQVFVLFIVGLSIEERLRRREVARR